MKIAVVTDAWEPQVNGVVRAIRATQRQLLARGHEVLLITPELFRTMPCPSYPEIRLALTCGRGVRERIETFRPDAIHLATEGPLGWAARRWCLDSGRTFSTSFHTRFAEYVALRTNLPAGLFWGPLRRFHKPASRVMVATDNLARELGARGITPTHLWPLGVDTTQFHPGVSPDPVLEALPKPLLLYVGRVAPEKNIQAFLSCSSPGTKVVVGNGPQLSALQSQYPKVCFLGMLQGKQLSQAYCSADVFVFPSRADTLGLVNLEALASGIPVAAFPVRGPIDILGESGHGVHGAAGRIGALHEDLSSAIKLALKADRKACRREAERYDWVSCTDAFENGLALPDGKRLAA